ncbi:MAG: Na-K-Cl cotransporter [Calditrichaeota bacterium]|nr:MAG: Na-K-Cl cotransporter [Calditrichota bacterium]
MVNTQVQKGLMTMASILNRFKLKWKKSAKSKGTKSRKFGTFSGVFIPDVLTILGVIMFLRLGWVVGNAGFLGAVVIILLAKSITICTGLSLASITTNIRIGAGGAYSIISKSLGLEAGGSIGIPFYISQTLSAALYIIGFTEGWLRIFPDHVPLVVATTSWLSLLVISYISAHFAIKVQYLIMAILAGSLLSFFLAPVDIPQSSELVGNFEDASFWVVFAIFFPAVTGIMAGANMSGDLKDPRRALPIGTLSSIFVTMVIYIVLAWVLSRIASPEELRTNQMIMVDKALWAPVIIAGILGATLSSALGSMLGAPRILQALAAQRTVPFHQFFAAKSRKNEPRNAIIFTGIFIEVALILGNIDLLASLITMFFLITYGMLNLVVFIQQSMRIISFRPTFQIPQLVSFLGATGCIFMMFLINAVFSIIAIIIIIILYIWLERRELKSNFGDLRGGLFLVLAERASRVAMNYPRHQISWKPDLLLPIDDPKVWAGPLLFIRNITYPSGSIFAFTVQKNENNNTKSALQDLLEPIKRDGVLVSTTVIDDSSFEHGVKLVIQTLSGSAFRPNILFLTIGADNNNDDVINKLVFDAAKNRLGVSILRQHSRKAFGMQRSINLWLRDKSPNWHLAMLISLQLQINWNGTINLVTASQEKGDEGRLAGFLEKLGDRARLPSMTEFHVLIGPFKDVVKEAPPADINIFGMGHGAVSFDFIREISELTKSTCLFVRDSGEESALV